MHDPLNKAGDAKVYNDGDMAIDEHDGFTNENGDAAIDVNVYNTVDNAIDSGTWQCLKQFCSIE